jgi:lipoprotein signal peptidase
VKGNVLGKVILLVILGMVEVFLQGYFRGRGIGNVNQGIAFGFQISEVFLVVTGLWLVLSWYLLVRASRTVLVGGLGWWLLWVGGGANILSRIQFGGVWDYIMIVPGLWFNGADVMIVAGVVERVYHYMKTK